MAELGFDSRLVCFRYLPSVTWAKPSSFFFRIGPQTVSHCPVSTWSRQHPCLTGDGASLLLLLLPVAREILFVSTASRDLQWLPIPGPQAPLPCSAPHWPYSPHVVPLPSFAFPGTPLSRRAFPCCSQPGHLQGSLSPDLCSDLREVFLDAPTSPYKIVYSCHFLSSLVKRVSPLTWYLFICDTRICLGPVSSPRRAALWGSRTNPWPGT